MNPLQIVNYRPEHQPHFERFNREWIEKYFEMEQRDIATLMHPEETIINKGGAVLMAEYEGIPAGAVALKKVNTYTYEFTKMAVDECFRRKGIAEALSYASFRKAKELGAELIILYSNSILTPAIRLYEKLGFTHAPVGDSGYKRSDVKMMITIEDAIRSANQFYLPLNS